MDLSRVLPEPASRIFICGSTGSGKSTLATQLLDLYHHTYRQSQIYVYDKKKRYYPVDPEANPSLFPHGYHERVIQRRRMVPLDGERVKKPHGASKDGRTWIYTDWDDGKRLLDWLYSHPSADKPDLLFADESFDFMSSNGRADPSFRRLMQEGRALGHGIWTINQAPRWIDGTLLRETESLFIGSMNNPDDRKHLQAHCMGTPLWKELQNPFPRYRWLYVNRVQWDKSKVFDMTLNEPGM